jgi:hypothetical protein
MLKPTLPMKASALSGDEQEAEPGMRQAGRLLRSSVERVFQAQVS